MDIEPSDEPTGTRAAASRRSLAATGALLVALVVGVQGAALPRPVLTGSDRSMEQYETFRANVARDGHHDLLVLGNFLALGSALSAQTFVYSPSDVYRLSEGASSATMFGSFAAGRYQFADDNHTGSAMALTEVALRYDESVTPFTEVNFDGTGVDSLQPVDQLVEPLLAESLHLAQAVRVFLDDPQGVLAERVGDPLGHRRPDLFPLKE